MRERKGIITTHWLAILLFSLIIFVRLYHIGADIPSARWSLGGEEVFSGYNARSKIIYDDWEAEDMGGFSPAYAPLSNILLYFSFKFFGVGIIQMRAPYAILTALTFILFYMLILREYGNKYALLITTQFGLLYWVVIWNRSALHQNLSLFYVVVVMLLFQRMKERFRDGLLIGLILPLSILIKIDHIVVFISGILLVIYLFIYKGKGEGRKRALQGLFTGTIMGLSVVAYTFWITEAFPYLMQTIRGATGPYLDSLVGTYGSVATGRASFDMLGDWWINEGFNKWLLLSYLGSAGILDSHWGMLIGKAAGNVLVAAPRIFMEIDPFGFIVFSLGAFMVWRDYRVRGLSPVETFSVILLILFTLFLALLPFVFYKRLIYVLPAIYFMIASFYNRLDRDRVVDNCNWKGLPLIIIVSSWLIFLFASASILHDAVVVPRSKAFNVIHTIWLHLSRGYILAIGFYGGIFTAVILYITGMLRRSHFTGPIRLWFKSLIYLSITISVILVAFEIVFTLGGHRYASLDFSKDFADLYGGDGRIAVLDQHFFRMTAFNDARLKFLLCPSGFLECPEKGDISYLVVSVLDGYTTERYIPHHEIREDINRAFPDALLVDEYRILDPMYPIPFVVEVFSVREGKKVPYTPIEPKTIKLGT
ncbi:MAG: hypothetical protein ACE5IH_03625 [Thermodesulfobacteriota bacterium]